MSGASLADNSTITKPCEMPCEKCGSTDCGRNFRAQGETWDTQKFGAYPNRFANKGSNSYTLTAVRDHIDHHCRTCQFKWQTPPLSKRRKSQQQEKVEASTDGWMRDFIASQQDLPPDMRRIIQENYWALLSDDEPPPKETP